jgi:protein-disulfide isomerase
MNLCQKKGQLRRGSTDARIHCFIRRAFCLLFVIGLSPLPSQAQHEGHDTVGWVPREILERPVRLRNGIGNYHEKTSTSSQQAQAFYDQGLNYLSAYVWIEAARSFNQALRIDANLAMAYIGLYDVFVHLQDLTASRAVLEKAQALAENTTALERQRIEIRAKQQLFLEDRSNMEKFIAYRKAIYDALMAHPNDPGLWILRGFADEGPMAGFGQTGDVDSVAFYQTALALSPDNSAAHHYLAHTFENMGRTENALKQSEEFLRLAPSIPHAHHMRGHELRRLGRIEDAIEEFRKANKLEDDYYRAEQIPPEYDWHRSHNLSLLALCHQLLGQVNETEKLLKEAFSLPVYDELGQFNRKQWPEFLLERGRTQEALEVAQVLIQSPSSMARLGGHCIGGRALLALNRVGEADGELASARLELERAPDPDRFRSYVELLRAEILLSEKKSAEGSGLIKELEESLRGSLSPDVRSQSLFQLESIAQRARETEEWALAEFTAREMIQQEPSYAGGYYALGLAAEQQGDVAEANRQFLTAERLWSEADSDLPELLRVRQKIAQQQSELRQTRRQFLKRLQESAVAPPSGQTGKVEVTYDAARLRGSPQAPVMIVEFSDFQCPFCRSVQNTLKTLLVKYGGQVSLAYRDFPLRALHSESQLGAESSRCAGEQGKFWEYHDLLFANSEKLSTSRAEEFAHRLGLNPKQFASCLSSGKYRKEIEHDLQDGIRAGVEGTPGIFINGVLISGAQPQAVFEKVIEEQLAANREKGASR